MISANPTANELWNIYSEKHVFKKTASPDTILYSWKNLQPHFGRMTGPEINQEAADDYEELRIRGRIGRPSKSSTVRKELVALRACWGWCAKPKNKLVTLAQLPCFDLPAESSPRTKWLTSVEIKKLLEAAEMMRVGDKLSRLERFLSLALETAARKQAILELTWDRVDFETGMVHYDIPGRAKTKKGRASVPMSPSLRPVLVRAYAERVNERVLEHEVNDIWTLTQLAVLDAGLAEGERSLRPKATGISPHVMRHTAATHMARRGVPLWTIAGVLGCSEAMVRKVYGHHCRAALLEAVSAISSIERIAA